jgi:uncharacterized membrane protein
MLAAGINSGIYKFVLVLHILSVVVGIGAVMMNGIYASQAVKRLGATGRAVSEANFEVSKIAEYVIYTIPIWGLALVGLSDKAWKFSQTWIWLSLVIYIVAIGISHGVMIPGHKRFTELVAEAEGKPTAEMNEVGQRLAIGGMTLNLIVVILIALMIWKPGA